jgi:AGCS family alanine or glycine:cation symporter
MNAGAIAPTFALIFREAFNPSAGIAGTGVGAFLLTMMWGVRRGLFSNEAGQGSAPIAHSAAKTDEPVSEGVVALLEPLIDTLVICTMTGLVVLITGVWNSPVATTIELAGGDLTYVMAADGAGNAGVKDVPEEIVFVDGYVAAGNGSPTLGWHEVEIARLFADAEHTRPFSGRVLPGQGKAISSDGSGEATFLHGMAMESGAPLTKLAFERGLSGLGNWGGFIVILSVLLFAISTAISWSYYGDRCANYLWGPKAVLPFKLVFVVMHFVGSVVALATVWTIGDIALGLVTFPNLVALVMLSGLVASLTKSYFERRPWEENAKVHQAVVASKKQKKS